MSTSPFHQPVYRPLRLAAALAATLAFVLALSGCAAGPDYVRPTLPVPSAYAEPGPWKQAAPGHIDPDGRWWLAYGDPVMDGLVAQANDANQNIALAAAQYRQASAAADAARSAFWPTAGISAGVGRGRNISNGVNKLSNSHSIGLDASWEPDLWGAVRRSVEAGEATAQASAAQLAAARLSIQAAVAQDYLQVRVLEREQVLYARTLEAYERALKLTRSQHDAGVALRSDVALAEAQLNTAKAESIDLEQQRRQLLHAIAILTGRAPADFTLPDNPDWHPAVPQIPVGLPSELLERRPDIATAERQAAAANANIGVARAAYFPSLVLSASGGFEGGGFGPWFNTPGRIWSLGAALAETLFDGGLRAARDAQAVAAYDATVAQYKQTVLGGFQEVEDNLSTLRILADESVAQDQAVRASRLAEQLALTQYRAGTVTYLNVVTAQYLTLSNERSAVQLLGRQLLASVALIKATGGGWTSAQLQANPASATAAAAPHPTPVVSATAAPAGQTQPD
ncbi:efflux transporter outer membrane subunit [Bordetella sp. N]|uniref:efflux transporter outer membrane subunit n=1 Tax=Bordetella sp. N TaxID=1746199 RepID=UPI0009E8518B|nr:efflux transporter outer membrane subunit [Bordetella sp. N]